MGHLELQSSRNYNYSVEGNFCTFLQCPDWKVHSPQSFILSVLDADFIVSGHSYGVWCVGTQVRDCVGDCECRIDIVSIAEYERPSIRITVLNGVVEAIYSSNLRSGP